MDADMIALNAAAREGGRQEIVQSARDGQLHAPITLTLVTFSACRVRYACATKKDFASERTTKRRSA